MTRSILAGFLVMMLVQTGQAETPTPGTAEPDSSARLAEAARQAWCITTLVLEKDIDPPTRQEMLLHALKSLAIQSKTKRPANLAELVSRVMTPEQLAVLLADMWPADNVRVESERERPESILFNGLLNSSTQ